MSRIKFLIVFLLVYPLLINGQEGCKTRKPVDLDRLPSSSNRMICDRFYHALSPGITKIKHLQLEAALSLRDEFYKGQNFIKSASPTFNIYSSYKLKYSLSGKFEFNLIFNELIFYSGDEIEKYAGENPYSRFSVGTKYLFFRSGNNKNICGLSGQVAFSKEAEQFNMYPELRILFLKELTPEISITSNIGAVYITKNNASFLYAIELKYRLTKKVEFIAENYTDYVHLNSVGKPCNRFLFGFGTFFRKNFYIYLTYEKGITNSDYLNRGKIDLGVAYRF